MTSGGVTIRGVPVQQGSKAARVIVPKGGGKPIATMFDDNSKSLKAWRVKAQSAIRTAYPGLMVSDPIFGKHEPVALQVRFVFGLRGEDNNAIRRWEKQADVLDLRHTSCEPGCVHLPWHTTIPDKDKCLRALFDALTAGHVWADDGQCCRFDVLAYRASTPMTAVRWAAM